jgi:hypothetical protein
VFEPVFFQNVFEGVNGDRILGEFRHGSSRAGKRCRTNKLAWEFPIERVSFEAIPVTDECENLVAQLRNAFERAVTEQTALQNREPDFDLVDPGGMQRRMNEAKATPVMMIELAPTMVFAVMMQVEVVPDHKHAPVGVRTRDSIEKIVKCLGRTLLDYTAEHAPSSNVESSEQVANAAAHVLELVPNAPIAASSIGIAATERLHRLLVNAHHDRISRRRQVKAADSSDLLREIRIWTVQPIPNAVRSQAFAAQDALYAAATDPHACASV